MFAKNISRSSFPSSTFFTLIVEALMTGFISKKNSHTTLAEIWACRYLIMQFVIRDLSVRYRYTFLGWLWAIINPALNLSLYYIVFGMIFKVQTPEYLAPYSLVLVSGLIFWNLFLSAMNAVSDSLENNLHLIKKIYFPRIVLTFSSLANCCFDFAISVFVISVGLISIGYNISFFSFLIVFFCGVIATMLGWGVGCFLAVLRIRFRDFRHIIPLFIQCCFYATPIVWTPVLVSNGLEHLLSLNPLNGMLALFRYALISGPFPKLNALCTSIVGCFIFTVVGYYVFVKYESQIVDRE